MTRLLPVLLVPLLVGACGGDAPKDPAAAQQTYGASVDPTDAIPVPSVVAETDRYVGKRVTVDGRITTVTADGCTLHLDAENGSVVHVTAPRSDEGACAWQVPTQTEGFAVATGTLRTEGDSLRLSAKGVQVTPLHPAGANSAP